MSEINNLFVIANELNGDDPSDFERMLERLEAKQSKSMLNKNHTLDKVEHTIRKLKMSIDRYHEEPDADLLEYIHKHECEAEILLELFKEDCLHPDDEALTKYSTVLEKFKAEI